MDEDFADDADVEFGDDADAEFDQDNDGFGDDGDGDDWGDGDGDGGWGSADELKDPGDTQIPINSELPDMTRQQSAVVPMSPEDIEKAMQEKVDALHEELDFEKRKCLLLLRKYKWNSGKIIDVYFGGTEKQEEILLGAGICLDKHKDAINESNKDEEMECEICMEDIPKSEAFALECGHVNTCKNCWIDYLLHAVKSKQCVLLDCPTSKCHVTIPSNVWQRFLAKPHPDAYRRYQRFCRENFVENSKQFVFCPGKSCELVYSSESGTAKEVVCAACSFRFCWACKQESHFPASCHTAERWLQKCSSEAENISWILAKCKRCPKCHIHIEKNQGCNHMTCRKHAGGCGHEFCWLCKGDWSKHGSATGGYYQCNIYEKQKADGTLSNEEQAQRDAQNELERYEFHYTRYDSHSKSSKHAIKQSETTHEKMHQLAQQFGWRLNETQFLLDAVNEAIQCWHVLAWTYPIAYYLDDKKFNLDLFKEQQGKLENFCDGLQSKLDFELEKLGENKTRQEIIAYTRTAKQYRTNLVEYIDTEVSF